MGLTTWAIWTNLRRLTVYKDKFCLARNTLNSSVLQNLEYFRTLHFSARQLESGSVKTSVTPYDVTRGSSQESSVDTKTSQEISHRMTLLQRVNIPMSHRKMNIVARILKDMPLSQAEAQVAVLNKKAARYLSPLLLRAKEKAVLEDKMDINRLKVGSVVVNQGPAPKRIVPWHGKGRFGVRKTYSCHVTVGLCEMTDAEIPKKKTWIPNHRCLSYRNLGY
ncbi:mitochondrial ribosomal protein L22 precursor [Galdieria sulphuraria]|uniref:Large ribosomal subunit protein uL22c n=1 Tax=Galdieria sulphuraria TaxID=130081 RepID=M2XH66_GALSU|nr:mitochondrial ribosomal protein L22 precursor [Galdieria sulphuraria]EME29412.1 mitochondrial ribosomal protein L22 precursor [Galdieria sulphuraria]|eukprot:XP_005705932.1 mitochondrial ribosomal protein L22 precursor [Galdieria sulphuraria]